MKANSIYRTAKQCILAACVAFFPAVSLSAAEKAAIVVKADKPASQISRHIYGQFSEHLGHCIYGGIWVGPESSIPNTDGYRNDIIEALKEIRIPNLRWPGGCFADEYHWRDGIGPRESRPKMINTHWGGVIEDNSFGTHEFLNFCELIGTEPYICGNVGSGTVEEMSKWVEYITFDGESPMANERRKNGREKPWKVKFWGVGNENWGCGGNMDVEFYSDQYKRYATFCRNYGDNRLMKIAGGANGNDFNWTKVLLKEVGGQAWGISLHNYTVPKGWGPEGKGPATGFTEEEYMITVQKALEMDPLIGTHVEIMDQIDPGKRVAFCVDEWGNWFDVEPGTNPGFLYQQNTLRDALTCASILNIFHKYSDRVKMANIAQMVNVLQSIILTQDDKMVLTPTYHIYNMYKVHQDATSLPIELLTPEYKLGNRAVPALNASASVDADGVIHVSIVNLDPNNDIQTSLNLRGIAAKSVTGQIVTAPKLDTWNDFDHPESITLKAFNGARINKEVLDLKVPSKSVITLEIK